MNYTKAQLIDALVAEYDYLCHDDFNPDTDLTLDEYRDEMEELTIEQLIEETDTESEGLTLDDYMEVYG